MSGHGGHGGGGIDWKHLFTYDELARDFLILVFIFVLIYIGNHITPINISTIFSGEAFVNIWEYIRGEDAAKGALALFWSLNGLFGVIAFGIFVFILWLTPRMHHVHHKEDEMYEPIEIEEIEGRSHTIQWQIILDHVNSENPAEWKLAVLEADSMMDDILRERGFQGESLGEILKALDPSDLPSYQAAWEGHKVRNQIAHEASTGDFSKKMARDAITNFEKVFKDLGVI